MSWQSMDYNYRGFKMAGLDVGKIIGNSFNTLFNNKAVLVMGVVAAVFSAVVQLVLPPPLATGVTPSLAVLWAYLFRVAAIGVVALLIGVYFTATIISAVRTKNLTKALGNAAGRYVYALAAAIVTGIIVGIGFILLIIPGIYLLIRLTLAVPSVVLENRGPIEGIKRSWDLTKGNWWNIFVVLLVVGIVVLVIQTAVTIFSTVLGAAVGEFFAFAGTIAYVLILQALAAESKQKPTPVRSRKR